MYGYNNVSGNILFKENLRVGSKLYMEAGTRSTLQVIFLWVGAQKQGERLKWLLR